MLMAELKGVVKGYACKGVGAWRVFVMVEVEAELGFRSNQVKLSMPSQDLAARQQESHGVEDIQG